MPSPRRLDVGLAATAAGVLALLALRSPALVYGDSGEYLLMAEGWARHGSPALRPDDVAALESRMAAAGLPFDRREVLGNYFEGRDGRFYCYHPPWYSLLTLPARGVLALAGGDVLKAGPLTNAVLLAGACASLLLGGVGGATARRLSAALLVTSPVIAFLRWPHPEVFSVALTTVALVALARGAAPAAVACAGIASMQNPPLALLAGALALLQGARAFRARAWRSLLPLALGALPLLLTPAYFFAEFRTANMAAYETAAVANVSVGKAVDLLFDLDLGLLPYVPSTLALFLAVAAAVAWRGAAADRTVLAALAAMLVASTAQGNWNAGTSGPSRFVVWQLPALYFLLAGSPAAARRVALRRPYAVLVALAVVLQAVSMAARGGTGAPLDYLQHSTAARFVLDRWPRIYRSAPEVFLERTRHTEADLDAPAIYETAGRCRKALARWKHGPELLARCGPLPEAARPFFEGRPPKSAKGAWVYVDY